MPTGYTANVHDGITFEQFVWQCARGMGALVTMRDEPTGAPIPERFEPSDYNAKRLQEAKDELVRLRAAVSTYGGHGNPGCPDRVEGLLALEQADAALATLPNG